MSHSETTPSAAKKSGSSGSSGNGGDPHDDRPFVADLLREHAATIEAVRRNILADSEVGQRLYDSDDRYDELWILRFVLTHKSSVPKATDAALKTLKFREDFRLNELGDLRHRLKHYRGVDKTNSTNSSVESLPGVDTINRYCQDNTLLISQPDPDRGVLVICALAKVAFHDLYQNFSAEDHRQYFVHEREAIFQVLDAVTRRTGRLTKDTRFLDMADFSVWALSFQYSKRDGTIARDYEDCYPQATDAYYFLNTPRWLSAIWKVLSPFFPKRAVEKCHFVSARHLSKPLAPYPRLLKHVSEANLPERYGGKNPEWPLPSMAETLAKTK